MLEHDYSIRVIIRCVIIRSQMYHPNYMWSVVIQILKSNKISRFPSPSIHNSESKGDMNSFFSKCFHYLLTIELEIDPIYYESSGHFGSSRTSCLNSRWLVITVIVLIVSISSVRKNESTWINGFRKYQRFITPVQFYWWRKSEHWLSRWLGIPRHIQKLLIDYESYKVYPLSILSIRSTALSILTINNT